MSSFDAIQYLSQDKLDLLNEEMKMLKEEKIPSLAKRIDEARQMGDLSENAEYHAAREEMAWAQSRVKELAIILDNVQVVSAGKKNPGGLIGVGSTLTVKVKGIKKEYTIVGAQEANPATGKISNESPLGQAFLGRKKGDDVQVKVPAGIITYEIVDVK